MHAIAVARHPEVPKRDPRLGMHESCRAKDAWSGDDRESCGGRVSVPESASSQVPALRCLAPSTRPRPRLRDATSRDRKVTRKWSACQLTRSRWCPHRFRWHLNGLPAKRMTPT